MYTHAPVQAQVHIHSFMILSQSLGPRAPPDPPCAHPCRVAHGTLGWGLLTHGMARFPWREPLHSTAPSRLGLASSGRGGMCGFLKQAREKPVSRHQSPNSLSPAPRLLQRPLDFDTDPSQRAGPEESLRNSQSSPLIYIWGN